MNTNKIYGGIYKQGPNQVTDLFLGDDQQMRMDQLMAPFYLWETMVHNYMLTKNGLVPKSAAKKILGELILLTKQVDDEGLVLDSAIGDLHENIEAHLTAKLGPDAGWFHLARSRNDQITCDQKLITKSLIFQLGEQLSTLGEVLGKKSLAYSQTIMPGFTHLRSAMPSSFGFWWQAYLIQIIEVQDLLKSTYRVVDINPLGAGASYGVNWPIDTNFTTHNLAFSQPFSNALAAINSRGVHESYWLGSLVSLTTILSRMMEDIIIWSMPEVDLIQISEKYTSGSSIMPQKINPDVAEKIRGKVGVILGFYIQTVTSLKGTASGYNRDTAETKVAIISALTETLNIVTIATQMLETIVPNEQNMLSATKQALATKVADQLSQKYNIPFRSAHQVIGACLRESNYSLDKIKPTVIEQCVKKIVGQKIKVTAKWLANTISITQSLSLYTYKGTPKVATLEKVSKELLIKNHSFYHWISGEAKKFTHSKHQALKLVKSYLEE